MPTFRYFLTYFTSIYFNILILLNISTSSYIQVKRRSLFKALVAVVVKWLYKNLTQHEQNRNTTFWNYHIDTRFPRTCILIILDCLILRPVHQCRGETNIIYNIYSGSCVVILYEFKTAWTEWKDDSTLFSSTFFFTWVVTWNMTSTVPMKQNVDVLSLVTRGHLEVFWLVWRRVDEMSQWSTSRPDDGTHAWGFQDSPSRHTLYVYNAIYDIHIPLARKIQYMFIQYMSHIQYVFRGSIFVQMWDLQTSNFDKWLYSFDRWSWLCVIQYFVWLIILRYCYMYEIYKNIPSLNHITFITLCRFRICQFSRYVGNFVSSRHASTWVICISA